MNEVRQEELNEQLHDAVLCDSAKLINESIKNGANVNAVVDEYENTVLHSAVCGYISSYHAHGSYFKGVKLLIENGADVNKGNGKGITPFHHAIYWGYTDTVKLLIENGADVNKGDDKGMTPLHYVIKTPNTDIAEILIENGANVNAVNEYGYTILHYAAYIGCEKIVKFLLANGVDINVVGKDGNTALGLIINPSSSSFLHLDKEFSLSLHSEVTSLGSRNEGIVDLVNHTTKLEAAGLYVSEKNLQGKNEFINTSNERRSNYLQHFQNCKEEARKIEKESKPLSDFLRENNNGSLVNIWGKNKDVRDKFNDQESLQAQYPEYADILISKANKVEKEIFLHNNKPLTDALPQLGYHGSGVPDKIRAFLEENRDRLKATLRIDEKRQKEVPLINFVDFKDTTTLHVPKLELCVAVSQAVRNNTPSTSLNNPNAEQLRVPTRIHS